jgi:site-specific DNA-methyltransferase (adenine-specific)
MIRNTEAEIKNVKPALQQTQCCTLPFVQLWNEDCVQTLERIETGSIDLMLQDTPFGCTQNEWDIKPNFTIMWQHWERVIKDNGAMIFFGTQPFASELILSRSAFFRYDLIWYKALGTGFLNANKMPMRNHEHILVFYKALPTYNPQMRKGVMKKKGGYDKGSSNYGKYDNRVPKLSDEYYPESVLCNFSNGDRTSENDHPTQKPLELIRYLIQTYSNENDVVFDGYSGSGTTAAACIKERRNFIGSEMNVEYFSQSVKRLEKISMQPELELR